MRNFIRRFSAVPVALLAVGLLAGPAAATHDRPSPGAPGIGDRLFPTLGNGGYDARHYTLSLRYPTADRVQTVVGALTMEAKATKALSRFNLDFDGFAVSAVWVDGRSAAFSVQDEELVITPRKPLRDDERFTATVNYTSGPYLYTFDPDPNNPVGGLPFGWFTTQDGSVTAGQPDLGHTIYPVNDHTADKATYSFVIDVPAGTTAAANGVLTRSRTSGGRTVWHYEMRQPMASQLIQVAVGQLDIIDQGRSRGVPLRDVVASTIADDPPVRAGLSHTGEHMEYMTSFVGRYPFDVYGILAADELFFYALETQTLSLHPGFVVDETQFPPEFAQPVLLHELAHQWFGDDLALAEWSDLWLSEGHATWYEGHYAEEVFGIGWVDRMHAAYEEANQLRADFGPVARPSGNDFLTLFSNNVYDGGGLVLYALHNRIGERRFYEIERTWAQRFSGESPSTWDFILHAAKVSRDPGVIPFLARWVFGDTVPPMPGHPDWVSPPASAGAPATAASSSARQLEVARLLKR